MSQTLVTSPSGMMRIRAAAFDASWVSVGLFVAAFAGIGGVSYAAYSGLIPYWAAFALNTVLFYYVAHVNHEAFHRNISGRNSDLKWLNDGIGRIISFSFFFSFPAFQAVHHAHHRFTNDPALDSDMWVARRHPLAVALSCLTLLNKYEFQMWRLFKLGHIPARMVVVFYLERLLGAAIVFWLASVGLGLEAVVFWLGPAFLTIPFLSLFFAYIVHHPHSSTETNQASNILLAPAWLQPLITAVFVFQNYHLVHHLNPRIPFYRYGEVFRRLRPQLEQRGAAIKRIF